MAWTTTMVTMLRYLINDIDDGSPTYTDTRLQQTLGIAAFLVIQEIDFSTTYTINTDTPSISPDPTTSNTSNNRAFTNFVVLKAGCIMDQSLYRTKALISGVKARAGPAILETTDHAKAFQQILEMGPCNAYQVLKKAWMFGNANVCKAIFNAFVSNNYDPSNLLGWTDRGQKY